MAHLYPPHTPYGADSRRAPPPIHLAFITFQNGEEAQLERFIDRERGYASFLDPDGRLGELLEQIARIGQQYGENGFWKA